MTTKTVLITGCSSGIGEALCNEYLQHGFTVIATARNPESMSHLSHDNLIKHGLDVNDADSIESIRQLIEQLQEQNGLQLHSLINNAGYAAMGPLADMPSDDLQAQFQTNVFAPIALTKALLPALTRGADSFSQSQVINIGSVSGITPTPFSGAYCATKAALHALSDALRMELSPFNIKVITVQPGAIESKFGDNSLANLLTRISDTSWYAPLKDAIKARATASQDNPTPAQEFAKTLLAQLLSKPQAVIRIGNGSTALPFMKRWLPNDWLDAILSKKFRLHELSNK